MIVSLVHFIAFFLDICLILLLLSRNSKAALNRFCVFLISTLALWSFSYGCLNLTQSSESAWTWMKIGSIGWGIFPASALYFYLSLTDRTRYVKSIPIAVAVLMITAFFIYQQWSGNIVERLGYYPYGWTGIWASSIYTYLYFTYYLVISVLCIYLAIDYGRKAGNAREKMGARLQSVTAAVSLFLATCTNVILPQLGVFSIPQIGDIFVSIWVLGIIVAITKYGFMSLTSTTAADHILSTMTDSLMLLDTDGTVRLANQAAGKMLGTHYTKLYGVDFTLLVSEKKSARDLIENTLQQGSSINRELHYITKDGSTIPVQISASRIVDNLKTTMGLVIVARDITEYKSLEERITGLYNKEKNQREELEEEAKARGMFIDILAHELRTPLTPILASSSMLCEYKKKDQDEITRKLSNNIFMGARTLAGRLEELLDLARFSRGTFTLKTVPIDLNEFIKEVVSRFSPGLDNLKQQLVLEVPPDLPVAEIDPSRLEQVLINLLSNASKYGKEKSQIILSAKYDSRSFTIEVKDFGMGIHLEEQKRLFQAYHRVEQDRQRVQGIGLGLAICKQIVEAHHGKIWVTSSHGKGSTFSFQIPLKQA
jgi:PAS domain S-box-containing protein